MKDQRCEGNLDNMLHEAGLLDSDISASACFSYVH